MAGIYQLRMKLTGRTAAALEAVAEELGADVGTLVTGILEDWGHVHQVRPTSIRVDTPEGVARRRLAILSGWWKARRVRGFRIHQLTDQYLDALARTEGIRVTRRTLYNWDTAWRQRGIEGLRDGRGLPRERTDDRLLIEVRRLFKLGMKPRLAECYRRAMKTANQKGWKVYSQRTAFRFSKGRQAKTG